MDRPVSIHDGTLVWIGEHWINALRPEGAAAPSAWVSLFHTDYSREGEGNVAQVLISGGSRVSFVAADNLELARYLNHEFLSRSSVRDPDAPIVSARFRREGDVRREPAWVIETDAHRIVARWRVTGPPVIAEGSFRTGTEHFTVLFFTDEASVELDGKRIEGKPYSRDIWKPTLGGDRSSCVFALAETLIQLPS
jgi:hypothetical protein